VRRPTWRFPDSAGGQPSGRPNRRQAHERPARVTTVTRGRRRVKADVRSSVRAMSQSEFLVVVRSTDWSFGCGHTSRRHFLIVHGNVSCESRSSSTALPSAYACSNPARSSASYATTEVFGKQAVHRSLQVLVSPTPHCNPRLLRIAFVENRMNSTLQHTDSAFDCLPSLKDDYFLWTSSGFGGHHNVTRWRAHQGGTVPYSQAS